MKKGIIEILLSILISLYALWAIYNSSNTASYLDAFLFGFLGSATLFLPTPAMLVIIALSRTLNPVYVGIIAGIGSALGEITGYLGGKGIRSILKKENGVSEYIKKYGVFAVFFFALVPNPIFDIAGLVAGALGMDWKYFFIATLMGRILRFTLLGYFGVWTTEFF